jgi:hypothetical protein
VKRGRPPEGFDEEIYSYVFAWQKAHGLSDAALARRLGVHRAYIGRARKRIIPIGKHVRQRIWRKIGTPDKIELLSRLAITDVDAVNNGLPGYSSPTSSVEWGFTLHMLRCYPQAQAELVRVRKKAGAERNFILQAEAAMRLAWLYCDYDKYQDVLGFATESIKAVAAHFGTSVGEIERAIDSGSSVVCGNDPAAHILRQALHLKGTALLSQVMHDRERPERAWTEATLDVDHAFAQSVALAKRLQLAQGEDLRWQALYVAMRSSHPSFDAVEDLFAESRNEFGRSEVGQAYVMHDRGTAYCYTDRPQARTTLLEAQDRLACLADPRDLAMTLLTLSNVTDSRAEGSACRDALAAAALNPRGLVAANAKTWAGLSTRESLRSDVEILFKGKGQFASVHQVLRRIALARQRTRQNLPSALLPQIAPRSELELIRDNLSSISPSLQKCVDEVLPTALISA